MLYYSIPVATCDQKYLMFQFAGQLYTFFCLPNGLTSAPRLFTKILKPVFAALHKEGYDIMGYLDDSILIGDNYDECKAAALKAVNLFQTLKQVHSSQDSSFTLWEPWFPSPPGKVFSNTKTENRFTWIY